MKNNLPVYKCQKWLWYFIETLEVTNLLTIYNKGQINLLKWSGQLKCIFPVCIYVI